MVSTVGLAMYTTACRLAYPEAQGLSGLDQDLPMHCIRMMGKQEVCM